MMSLSRYVGTIEKIKKVGALIFNASLGSNNCSERANLTIDILNVCPVVNVSIPYVEKKIPKGWTTNLTC